ncbi:MAG TPA: chemotaxis protein CheW [Candidatus Dormibacteraeota bacterium]|nr:chemotaxis protein CheW [Candidatus Dormibacteraeota bacterium]
MLVLAVNSAYFALSMETVHQVIRRPIVTRVPLPPPGLLGIVNVRGEIVPFLDTGVLTGTGALSEPAFAVLVRGAGEMLAVAANELPVRADLESPVGPGTRPGELGLYSHLGHLVTLIDVEALADSRLNSKRAS